MATLPLIRYPLDPTGVNPDNLVQGELHTLLARQTRVVAPTYGAFYSGSLVVRDTSNNQVLVKNVQYYAAELYEVPSAKFGKEVCAIVVITDASVSNNISLEYQAVGGEFSAAATAIVQQIEALNLDARPVQWGSIIEKPSEYPPSHHLHDIGDIYGFEYVVHALDRIRAAILMGDDLSHDTIYQYVDSVKAELEQGAQTVQNNLQAHLSDTNNPHQVTAAQLNVYTKPETNAQIAASGAALDNHKSDFGNPHQVTAAQVGAPTLAVHDAAVSNLQTQINGKQNTGDYALLNSQVTFTNIFATGTIYSYNDIWAFYSDQRIKTDVRVIPNALEKVRKIRGVLYKHTPEAIVALGAEDRDYMGVIAQEIQAIAPEIVGLAAFDRDPQTGLSISGKNYLTVQYDKLAALLIEALKESDSRVSEIARRLGYADLI